MQWQFFLSYVQKSRCSSDFHRSLNICFGDYTYLTAKLPINYLRFIEGLYSNMHYC